LWVLRSSVDISAGDGQTGEGHRGANVVGVESVAEFELRQLSNGSNKRIARCCVNIAQRAFVMVPAVISAFLNYINLFHFFLAHIGAPKIGIGEFDLVEGAAPGIS